jgi:hypothetical protein
MTNSKNCSGAAKAASLQNRAKSTFSADYKVVP